MVVVNRAELDDAVEAALFSDESEIDAELFAAVEDEGGSANLFPMSPDGCEWATLGVTTSEKDTKNKDRVGRLWRRMGDLRKIGPGILGCEERALSPERMRRNESKKGKNGSRSGPLVVYSETGAPLEQ
jgi:hypothetical protein